MNTYNFKGTNWLKFFVGFAIAVSFAWSPRVAHADPEQDAILMGRPLLRQNGKLFVIQFAPKARRVDILTAGKSVATLDPSSVKIFGRVFPIGGSPHDLKMTWSEGHFNISEPIDASVPVEFEVSDKVTAKTETFRFDKSSAAQTRAPSAPEKPASVSGQH